MYKILLRSALATAFSVALAFGALGGAKLAMEPHARAIGADSGWDIAHADSGWDIAQAVSGRDGVQAAPPPMDSGWDSAPAAVPA
jgi:hypothetical protein